MNHTGQDQYGDVLRNFFKSQGGILAVTGDFSFSKFLRNSLKHLDDKLEHLHFVSDLAAASRKIAALLSEYKQLVLIIESTLNGKPTFHIFKQVKRDFFGRTKIICTTAEIDRKMLLYISEIGADNVVVKPVNTNCLIQKIALTIQPNSNLFKLVDGAQKLISRNKLDEGSQLVDLILREKPDSAIGHMLRGDIHRLKNEPDRAELSYKIAMNNSKLYLEPLKRLAELYHDIGDTPKRLEFLKQLDHLSPMNHDRKIEIGESHLELGDNDQAKSYFSSAIKILRKLNDDAMSSTLMDIALKLKDKDPQASLEYMEQAISLKESYLTKDDIWMINEIGIHLRKSGKHQQAIEYYKKALAVSKEDGAIYYNIGMAHSELQSYRDALLHFEKAVELTPEILRHGPNIPYNIAHIFNRENRPREALYFYLSCNALDPDYKDVKQQIAALQATLKRKGY